MIACHWRNGFSHYAAASWDSVVAGQLSELAAGFVLYAPLPSSLPLRMEISKWPACSSSLGWDGRFEERTFLRQCVGFWNLADWNTIWVGSAHGRANFFTRGARNDRGYWTLKSGDLRQSRLGDVHHHQHGRALQGFREPVSMVPRHANLLLFHELQDSHRYPLFNDTSPHEHALARKQQHAVYHGLPW